MTPVIVQVLRMILTVEWAKKLAGVWLVSFMAASAGIIARRFHKEPPGRWPARRP